MGSRVGRRSKYGRDLWLFWEGCVPEGARTWGESPRGGMGPVVLFALESGTAVAQKFELVSSCCFLASEKFAAFSSYLAVRLAVRRA